MTTKGGDDRKALDGLARKYAEPLRRFFARKGRALDNSVDDLVQEVFLRLLRRSNLQTIVEAENYVFRTASNVLTDHRRRGRVRREADHDGLAEFDLASEEPSPERVLIGKDDARRVAEALTRLPERTRTIFVLNRFEGMSYSQIAHALEISTSAVEKHMMKAIAHLMQRMEQDS
jgi:RNA polymerase sigma-70 factor (ECF subfamily)